MTIDLDDDPPGPVRPTGRPGLRAVAAVAGLVVVAAVAGGLVGGRERPATPDAPPTAVAVDAVRLDPDGGVVVDLRSASDGPAEVFVTLAEGSGAEIDGTNGASALVDPGAARPLVLAPVVVDCAAARAFLAAGGPTATARTRAADGVTTGRLDGWDDRVVAAALGFAVARDCR